VSAREEVLTRIRAANAAARPTAVEVPRDYRRSGAHPPGAPELVELLRDRLVDYRAAVLDATPDDVPAVVATGLAEHPGPVLVPPGLPDGPEREPYLNALNERLMTALRMDGRAFPTNADLNGTYVGLAARG